MESGYLSSLPSILSGIVTSGTDFNLLIEVPVLAFLLIVSAIISASEVAYFSFSPEDLRHLRSIKSRQARIALKLHGSPEKLLSTILVANNAVNIAFIFLASVISFRIFTHGSEKLTGFILGLAAITFLLLLGGEILPKFYASRHRVQVALFFAGTLNLLQKLFFPVTSGLTLSSAFMRKRQKSEGISPGKGNGTERNTGPSEDDKILRGIANFGNTNVSAIMCPRIDVTSIDIKSSFDKIIPVIINSGFSRIPVYSGSFDTVKGILYAKDVLPFANNPANFKWQSLLRPSYFVPETKKINDLLKEFQVRKIHLAIVIDEYGGTSGIVTLEDILEEIVGEITDESDEEETLFRRIDESKFIFEGRILLHEFCRVMGIDEEIFREAKGESETLAGLILELTGEIPQKDHEIKYGGFTFRIESVDRRRIREILVEINNNDGKADEV